MARPLLSFSYGWGRTLPVAAATATSARDHSLSHSAREFHSCPVYFFYGVVASVVKPHPGWENRTRSTVVLSKVPGAHG